MTETTTEFPTLSRVDAEGVTSTYRVIDNDGRLVDKKRKPAVDQQLLVRIHGAMIRGREIDQRLTRLQRQGRIGFHVGAEGEEGAIVAATAALREQDWVFPCYREVGAALWRGLPLQTYVDNMYGNEDDVCLGRQMPDHVSGAPVHYTSVTAPIGTQITQAVGFAMAAQIKREDTVAATFFGDGATSSNDFHAALTMAGVRRAPVVFLLRNNGWAISVPSHQQSACAAYVDKAAGYGVIGERCDGNDAIAVHEVVRRAVERASSGGGPTMVEMVTYRSGAHTTSDDPTAYRDAEEVARMAEGDPIARLGKYLQAQGAWSDAQQEAHVEAVAAELRACVERAEKAGPPSIESMFEDVYAQVPRHLRKQQAECVTGPRAKKRH